jgi:hypothetical protein
MRNKSEYQMTKTCLNNWKIRILKLSFDFAQDGEPFDPAHGREPAERPVEPFRISNFVLRILNLNSSKPITESYFVFISFFRT